MATKKKTTKKTGAGKQKSQGFQLAGEVVGILLIALGLIMAVSVYSASQAIFIAWFRSFCFGMFGVVGYALPVCTIAGGIWAIAARGHMPKGYQLLMGGLGFLSLLSLIELCYARPFGPGQIGYFPYLQECYQSALGVMGGGLLGGLLAYPVALLLDQIGAIIFFSALIAISFIVLTGISIRKFCEQALNRTTERRKKEEMEEAYEERPVIQKIQKAGHGQEKNRKGVERAYKKSFEYKSGKIPSELKSLFIEDIVPEDSLEEDALESFPEPAKAEEVAAAQPWPEEMEELQESPAEQSGAKEAQKSRGIPPAETTVQTGQGPATEDGEKSPYQMPPMDLLNPPALARRGRDEAQNKAAVLEKTLQSFHIDAKVIHTSKGPTVTRYELQPAAGVKVSKIVNLSNDIALNMAASSIRIEAPIPGKAAIGIEVPNDKKSTVTIREMLDTDEFKNHKSKLAFAVGKDISGKNIYGDLAKMPHLLIAGTTGAGKSVCVNGIIMSYLYHTPPNELEFVMVDPKVVEMEMYNGIPYLIGPVITDPKKAAQALNQSVTEMLNRYKLFAQAGVKDIDRYNLHCQQNGQRPMKKRVIIVDELADLMMASAHEVEDAICRIAQLGRASGIHLIIATQSPRVDVITGLIKANIPSRIALTVSSAIDSRTIIDMGGAEKLLYNGDMLYMPVGASKPMRLQGCYVTDQENERVLEYIRGMSAESNYDEEFVREVESAQSAKEQQENENGFEDELIPKALQLALEYEQISISMLQRRLKVGYARAARLVDELEVNHLVSPADGSKPRQVLITWEDYYKMFGGGEEH